MLEELFMYQKGKHYGEKTFFDCKWYGKKTFLDCKTATPFWLFLFKLLILWAFQWLNDFTTFVDLENPYIDLENDRIRPFSSQVEGTEGQAMQNKGIL